MAEEEKTGVSEKGAAGEKGGVAAAAGGAATGAQAQTKGFAVVPAERAHGVPEAASARLT